MSNAYKPKVNNNQITDNVVLGYSEVMCQSLTRSRQLETPKWIGYSSVRNIIYLQKHVWTHEYFHTLDQMEPLWINIDTRVC